MTYEQYWDGDCQLVKYYRKAHEMQQDRRNQELWLLGLYVYEAVSDLAPILHAFAKSGTKPHPYPNEPFPRTAKEVRERKERDERKKFEQHRARLAAWKDSVNALMKRKEDARDG